MKGEQQAGKKRMVFFFEQQIEEEIQADDDGQMQNQIRIVKSCCILRDLIVEPHGKTDHGTIFSTVKFGKYRQGIEDVLEMGIFQKMRIVVGGERNRHALLIANERDGQRYRQ